MNNVGFLSDIRIKHRKLNAQTKELCDMNKNVEEWTKEVFSDGFKY